MRVTSFGCVLVALALAGCGEKSQALDAGKKKPDVHSFKGQGDAYKAAGWTNGDAASWEAQIKERNQGQNEYSRTANK